MRFLVLTSIAVTAATATAIAQPGQLCQVDDRAVDTASGQADQDQCRRQAPAPLVAIPVSPPVVEPLLSAGVLVHLDELQDAQITRTVIAFAPKTSPPRARWF